MKVIYRLQWGARPAKNKAPLAATAVRHLVVHYSASDADEQADHKNCAKRVRGIQNYHMDTQGWSDIAYNWLVCKHGYIFKGRGWGIRSAATGDANSYTVAVCFLGDDTKGKADVTPEAKKAIKSVLAFVKKRAPRLINVKGHRDFMSTSCPGDELYAFLKTLNKEL
jgi:hypothetical protein